MTEEGPRWIHLTTEMVAGLTPADDVHRAITAFEPLPFPAGYEAAEWLRTRLSERRVPLETQVALKEDATEVLGFYAMRRAAFNLSKRDRPILEIRELSIRREVRRDPQPGSLVEWIARNRRSPAGFGVILAGHALGNAAENGSVAVLMEPRDEQTAAIWLRREHGFMWLESEAAEESEQPRRLWHPVREARGGWPS